jgi:hypothetical protein
MAILNLCRCCELRETSGVGCVGLRPNFSSERFSGHARPTNAVDLFAACQHVQKGKVHWTLVDPNLASSDYSHGVMRATLADRRYRGQ